MAAEDIAAIDEYIRSKRVLAGKYPRLTRLIDAWVTWYRDLPIVDTNPTLTLAEAKRRREEINAVIGTQLPSTWTPADAGVNPPAATAPPPEGGGPLDDLENKVTTGLKVLGGIAVGYVLLKLFL